MCLSHVYCIANSLCCSIPITHRHSIECHIALFYPYIARVISLLKFISLTNRKSTPYNHNFETNVILLVVAFIMRLVKGMHGTMLLHPSLVMMERVYNNEMLALI